MKTLPTEFDIQSIRRMYDEDSEFWWFSVIGKGQNVARQANKKGNELVTCGHQLKMIQTHKSGCRARNPTRCWRNLDKEMLK